LYNWLGSSLAVEVLARTHSTFRYVVDALTRWRQYTQSYVEPYYHNTDDTSSDTVSATTLGSSTVAAGHRQSLLSAILSKIPFLSSRFQRGSSRFASTSEFKYGFGIGPHYSDFFYSHIAEVPNMFAPERFRRGLHKQQSHSGKHKPTSKHAFYGFSDDEVDADEDDDLILDKEDSDHEEEVGDTSDSSSSKPSRFPYLDNAYTQMAGSSGASSSASGAGGAAGKRTHEKPSFTQWYKARPGMRLTRLISEIHEHFREAHNSLAYALSNKAATDTVGAHPSLRARLFLWTFSHTQFLLCLLSVCFVGVYMLRSMYRRINRIDPLRVNNGFNGQIGMNRRRR
jgi:hypothetical protein